MNENVVTGGLQPIKSDLDMDFMQEVMERRGKTIDQVLKAFMIPKHLLHPSYDSA